MIDLLLSITFILELILVIWAFVDIFKRREKNTSSFPGFSEPP